MELRHSERVLAVWFRSGVPKPEGELPAAIYTIPAMCNAGVKEQQDRFAPLWTASLAWFKRLRAKRAPIGFAPDPRTSHECGDSRYVAIPFLDACLAMRLPEKPGGPMRPVREKSVWLGTLLTGQAVPAARFHGNQEESVWLPEERVAKAWAEYVKMGTVGDGTPPPPPFGVRAVRQAGGVELTWQATADFETGIQAFRIERDGKPLAQVPEKPVGRFGRPLFQTMSYHDTPQAPLPEMRYVDATASGNSRVSYRVTVVNGAGLQSAPSKPAMVR
jgi:hypothetical protein